MKKTYSLLKGNQDDDSQFFLVNFWREQHSGIPDYTHNRKISGWYPTDALGQTLGPNLITRLPVYVVSYQCFSVSITVFDKQENIRCSIGSISMLISSRHHNTTNQAIAVERYQSYFKNLDYFFTGKQQTAVTQPAFTCSNLTLVTLEQKVEYVQS